MTISIHQPNFMPWIGYFHKIKQSDVFVFLNDVQFERGKTVTSRTKILQQGEPNWLSVPVMGRGDMVKINEIQVENSFVWKKKHLRTLELNYKKTPFFHEVFPLIEAVYGNESFFLQDYNRSFVVSVAEYLGLSCSFKSSDTLNSSSVQGGAEKILAILLELDARVYVSGSGSGSRKYITEDLFKAHDIALIWQSYNAKPYEQIQTKSFFENLSMVDLLFRKGKNAIDYL